MIRLVKFINFKASDSVSDMGEFMNYLERDLIRKTEYILPMRQVITIEESTSVWLSMPAVDFTRDVFLVKLVSEYKKNQKISLPKSTGLTMLAKATTGEILAILDSNYVTALRTGALAGLCAKYVSRADATTLGVIGSGLEAFFLTRAMLVPRKLEKVVVFSRDPVHRKDFVDRIRKLGVDSYDAGNANQVVDRSDILIVATDSEVPVIDGNHIKEGCHISSSGTLPNRKELDLTTIERANHVILDKTEFVLKEAGDIMGAVDDGVLKLENLVELEDILSKKVEIPRKENDITLFKSVGYATLDVISAKYIYEKAVFNKKYVELDM